jgi:hypothetical protein
MEFLIDILENKAVKYSKDLNKFKRKIDSEIFEQMDIDLPDHKFLLTYLKNGWDKFDDYYNLINKSSAYAQASQQAR